MGNVPVTGHGPRTKALYRTVALWLFDQFLNATATRVRAYCKCGVSAIVSLALRGPFIVVTIILRTVRYTIDELAARAIDNCNHDEISPASYVKSLRNSSASEKKN